MADTPTTPPATQPPTSPTVAPATAPIVTAMAVIPTVTTTPLSPQDTQFLQQAELANLTEINEANLALTKAPNDITTREFARWMLGDHTANNSVLSTVAKALGVTLPTAPSASQQAELTALNNQTDTGFSQLYATTEVQDHQASTALFQQEITSGSNPTLIAIAQQTLPLLQAHLTQSYLLAGTPTPMPLPIPTGTTSPPIATTPAAPLTTGPLSAQDSSFVQQAVLSNQAEIAEAQKAIGINTASVGEFARWMIADHTAATTSLSAIVDTSTVSAGNNSSNDTVSNDTSSGTTPTNNTSTPTDTALPDPSDPSFASVYASNQVLDHVKAVMQFMTEAQQGTDPNLVQYAQSAIPVLSQHLAGAIELRAAVSGQPIPQNINANDLNSLLALANTTPQTNDMAPLPAMQNTTRPATMTPAAMLGVTQTPTTMAAMIQQT